MSLHFIKEAISPKELLREYPLPKEHALLKIERDKEIKKVFTGESDKFLVIIGPCSADNEDAV
ncbi:MAG: 3-deoxy-7-phosphoheptulonate synthase, partial [Acetivibrio ethanolgignens]